jgi:2-C-methyl-D-erythritol 4-phosphate cytidylyltransferase
MAVALIVAAGSGERLGADRPKAFVVLGGKPMVQWSVDAFREAGVDEIVVALPRGEKAPEGTIGVPGGETRAESVSTALAASAGDPVVIHDAARPLVTAGLIRRALDELAQYECDGVVVASRVTDTIKLVREEPWVAETVDRESLWAAQTPQVLQREALERGLSSGNRLVTDDVSLVEPPLGKVRVVEGPPENLKVTTPADLRIAEALLGC